MVDTRIRAQAVLFAVIMVVSMVAAGASGIAAGQETGPPETITVETGQELRDAAAGNEVNGKIAGDGTTIGVANDVTVNDSVNVRVSGVTIQNASQGKKEVAYQPSSPSSDKTIRVNAGDVTIQGLTVRRTAGGDRGADSGFAHGIVIRNRNGGEISGVTISNVDIVGSGFDDQFNRGLQVLDGTSAKNADASDITVTDSSVNGFYGGMSVGASYGGTISNVEFTNNNRIDGTTVGFDVSTAALDGGDGGSINSLSVTGNTFGEFSDGNEAAVSEIAPDKSDIGVLDFKTILRENDLEGAVVFKGDSSDARAVTQDGVGVAGVTPDIQPALNTAQEDDTVEVATGDYLDSDLTIETPGVTLTSATSEETDRFDTEIRFSADEEGRSPTGTATIDVRAPNVTISDLSVYRTPNSERTKNDPHAQGIVVREPGVTLDNLVVSGTDDSAIKDNEYNRFDGITILDTSGENNVRVTDVDVLRFHAGIVVSNYASDSGVNGVSIEGGRIGSNTDGVVVKSHLSEEGVSDVSITDLRIRDSENAGVLIPGDNYQGYSLAPLNASQVNVTGNDITSNGVGVVNNGTNTLNATENWWGSLDGPTDNDTEGKVAVAPWLDNTITRDGEPVTQPVTNVDDDESFASIQAAIDAADPNDVIRVAGGTYDPFSIDVKGLTVTPQSIDSPPTITNDGSQSATVRIDADDVSVSGLTIQNDAGDSFDQGIRATGTGVSIADNTISANSGSSAVAVFDDREGLPNGGAPVPTDVTIQDNTIQDAAIGVNVLSGTSESTAATIKDNTIEDMTAAESSDKPGIGIAIAKLDVSSRDPTDPTVTITSSAERTQTISTSTIGIRAYGNEMQNGIPFSQVAGSEITVTDTNFTTSNPDSARYVVDATEGQLNLNNIRDSKTFDPAAVVDGQDIVPDTASETGPGIEHPTASGGIGSTDDRGRAFAEVLNAAPENSETFEFGSGVDRSIQIRHPESGDRITITPQEGEETYDANRIRLDVYGGFGEIPRLNTDQTSVGVVTTDTDGFNRVNVTVEGDTDIFTSREDTFNEYQLALVEGGEVVDTSDRRLIGVDYRATLEQDSTTGDITITVPRDDEVPEDWFVEFELGNETMPSLIETDVENTAGAEEFETTIDASDLEPDEYFAVFGIFQSEDAPFNERTINLFDDIQVEEPADTPTEPADPTVNTDTSSITPSEVTTGDEDDYTATVELENLGDVTTGDVTVSLVDYANPSENTNPTVTESGVDLSDDTATVTVSGGDFSGVEAPATGTYDVVVTVDNLDGDVDSITEQSIGEITVSEADLGIKHADSSAGSTGGPTDDGDIAFAEVLSAAPENRETMEFGSGVDRAIEIQNPETGDSVRITPQADQGTYDVDRIRLGVYSGSGNIYEPDDDYQPNVGLTVVNGDESSSERINVTVEGDTDIFTSREDTFNEFELALVENGDVVDTSGQRLIGVGYRASFEQDGTEDEITVTIPRDEEVSEDWYATFRLGGSENGVETDVENVAGAEEFEATVDVSELEPGLYTGRLELYKSEDAALGDRIINVFGVDEFRVGDQADIQPEVTLQPPAPASQASPVGFSVSVEQQEPETVTVEVLDSDGNVVFEDSSNNFEDEGLARWDTTNQNGDVVADGEYDVVVSVEDEYGNEVTAEDTVTVDNTAPTIENFEVVEPANDETNDQITVRADVSDAETDIGTAQAAVIAEFTSYSTTEDYRGSDEVDAVLEGDTLEVTFDAASISDDVGDGDFTTGIAVVDTAGNDAVVESDPITIDTAAPAISTDVSGLTEETATLTVEADEDISITNLDIEAAGDGTTEDRTPGTFDTEVTAGEQAAIEFTGGTVGSADTTFTAEIEVEDAAGNMETYTQTSSITGYQIEQDGTADVEPDAVDSLFALATNLEEGADTDRQASVAQSETVPAGTELAADQIAGEFIDVSDIGLTEAELEEADVKIPLSEIDIEGVDTDELTMLYSPDGESDYETIEADIVEEDGQEYIVATVDGFSQLAPAGVDNEAPTIQSPSVDPGTNIDLADDGDSATVTFDYSDELSEIDIRETSVDVSGADADRVNSQITKSSTEVDVTGLEDGESIDVEITVVDDAGNEAIEDVRLSIDDSSASEDDGNDGGGGGGGGGGIAPPSDTDDEETDDQTTDEQETDDQETDSQETDDEETDSQETDDEETDDQETDDQETDGTDSDDAGDDTTDGTDSADGDDGGDDTTDDGTPGFGAIVALVAVIAAALLATRRQDR